MALEAVIDQVVTISASTSSIGALKADDLAHYYAATEYWIWVTRLNGCRWESR